MRVTSFVLPFLLCLSVSGLEINFYPTLGQIFDQVSLKNGLCETYFDANDYNDIVTGSIDFPGATLIEQDIYSSNELLRNVNVYVRSSVDCNFKKAKLVDPYAFLVKEDSKFLNVEQKNIKFDKEPHLNGKILSARLKNYTATRSQFTYLTRGLSWTPRYDLNVINETLATLRALVDIGNTHQRTYQVTNSTLTSGTVYLINSSPSPLVFYSANSMAPASILSTLTASNYGTYTYQINKAYTLYPQSIKTLPFITPHITFAYTLETIVYIQSSESSKGLFERTFNIKPSEFLPAGSVTFYQNTMVLGQASIADTAKNASAIVTLGTDPDIEYKIDSIVNVTRQSPLAQDLSVNITFINRKEKQTVTVKLTLNLNDGYYTTSLGHSDVSSGLTITVPKRMHNTTLIVLATVKPGKEENASLNLKQSN